jgi:hypothetical protein
MSLTRDDGIERSRRREYDRMRDWYEETVLSQDGSEYYHVAEPLSEHVERGSAKPPRSTL